MGKFDVLLNLILKKMHQVNTVTYIPEMRNRRLPEWEWHVMGSVASMDVHSTAPQCQPQNPAGEQLALLGGGPEGGGEGAAQWLLRPAPGSLESVRAQEGL